MLKGYGLILKMFLFFKESFAFSEYAKVDFFRPAFLSHPILQTNCRPQTAIAYPIIQLA
jgi:hypothetical protein